MPIKVCNGCKPHPFQDETYGKDHRVFNKSAAKDSKKMYCTVCDKEHGGTDAKKK